MFKILPTALICLATIALSCHAASGQSNNWQLLTHSANDADVNGDYAKARQLYLSALAEIKKTGTKSPASGIVLAHIAKTFLEQGELSLAEPYYKEALAIAQPLRQSRFDNEVLFDAMEDLAGAYDDSTGKNREAACRNALNIRDSLFDQNHLGLFRNLNNLFNIYVSEGKYKEAEPILKRIIEIQKKKTGQSAEAHLIDDTQRGNARMAILYDHEGRTAEAERMYRSYIAYLSRSHDGKFRREVYTNLIKLLNRTHRAAEAAKMQRQFDLLISSRRPVRAVGSAR